MVLEKETSCRQGRWLPAFLVSLDFIAPHFSLPAKGAENAARARWVHVGVPLERRRRIQRRQSLLHQRRLLVRRIAAAAGLRHHRGGWVGHPRSPHARSGSGSPPPSTPAQRQPRTRQAPHEPRQAPPPPAPSNPSAPPYGPSASENGLAGQARHFAPQPSSVSPQKVTHTSCGKFDRIATRRG